jgi:hypothetical protein
MLAAVAAAEILPAAQAAQAAAEMVVSAVLLVVRCQLPELRQLLELQI